MTSCIFCQIISGKIPSYQIYQDDLFVAFLDINPLAPGHTLLVPKKHYRWVYNVPQFGLYWQIARRLALAAQKASQADFISFLTLGAEVPHAHIHIIPRFINDPHRHGIDTTQKQKISPSQMTQIAQKIKNLIKNVKPACQGTSQT